MVFKFLVFIYGQVSIKLTLIEAVAERSTAIKRPTYHVNRPNEVWHTDGNYKFIIWRLVVHGGIDGYSRTITFLRFQINNSASHYYVPFEKVGISMACLPKSALSMVAITSRCGE